MNREEAKKKAEALVARMTLEEKASQLKTDWLYAILRAFEALLFMPLEPECSSPCG